ncbi:conserved hypothetical protein [Desulfamplus magnetovallimortis]|uniref:HAMP domain-containing protein n=1 Tax=Desulfamplus magnetovallimortis TaxID=1246637 RepID=A0A1W1H6N0_9BACT|nr:hypothetical protein [Desulfamplus magnetovallimortis]SLM28028.1 conserved hypothetical protein [Desulfamplus magnetovallimortis]
MQMGKMVRVSSLLLIVLNILMALGSVWIFMRMTPAIQVIIERNEHSLQACEEMLASLSLILAESENNVDKENKSGNENKADNENKIHHEKQEKLFLRFESALERAMSNITEKEEPTALDAISLSYKDAFWGDVGAVKNTVEGVVLLGKINRQAMIQEDLRAQQFGRAGAWTIVFMAIAVFVAGMIFNRYLRLRLIKPLEEMDSVIRARNSGDMLRRCSGNNLTDDFRKLFNGINDIFDSRHGG